MASVNDREKKTYESDLDEVVLWKGLITGDSVASEQLYRQYYPLLYSYGFRMIADKELVVDAIQNLFVKLLVNCKKLPATNHVKTYILSAFRNQLVDNLKASSRFQCISLEEETFSITEDFMISLFDKDDTEVWQEKKLAQAISRLSSRQREVLYLYYIKGLSHRDIATILSMNTQSSKNLLSRTLIQIRQYCLSITSILFFQGLMSFSRSSAINCWT